MRQKPGKDHEYEADAGGKAAVRVGGDTAQHGNKFRPEIHAEKFGGKAWLRITHADVPATAEKFKDGKLEVKHGKVTHRFYEVPDA